MGAVMKGVMKGKKAAAGKVLSKTQLADAVAAQSGLSKKECITVFDSLASVASKSLKSVGKVTIPGLAMIKTRQKAATKAGKREMFGKVVVVKAKPAKTVVKCFAVAGVKKLF